MEHKNESVYSLVTKLCEKFAPNHDEVKKLRSLSYEILLKKRHPDTEKVFNFEAPTPMIDLLAWIFQLNSYFNLSDYGQKLKKAAEDLEACYEDNSYEFDRILRFLLDLRQVPPIRSNPLDLDFDVPVNLTQLFNPKSVKIPKETITFKKYNEEEDIWYLALKTKIPDRKNWENFGSTVPVKEPPFLCELGDDSQLFTENLSSVYFEAAYKKPIVYKPKVRSVEDFVSDLKYLMTGLSSASFNYDEQAQFYLVFGITVKGLAPNSVNLLTSEMMECGSCCKALVKMCSQSFKTEQTERGFIFKEFCQSIESYLNNCRTAIFNIEPNIGPLGFCNITKKIRQQILALTSICKLGPYAENNNTLPQGVTLLNYLYNKINSMVDRDVLLVLYSIFYPCCQVYYNRFLQQWVLDGTIVDPYNEFFIREHSKYISTRGRTYWTRSFTVSEDKVPDFIPNIENILNCGKSINLLKLCKHSNKIAIYLRDKRPPIFSCCVTFDKLTLLEHNCTRYFLEVSSELGPKLSLETLVKQNKEIDPSFSAKVLLKRANTLKRIESERRKKISEEKEKKLEQITMLKEQYDLAMQQKHAKLANEIEKELKNVEDCLINDRLRDKIIKEESEKLIKYYEEMNKISVERKEKIDKNIELYKTIVLNPESCHESFPLVQLPPSEPMDTQITPCDDIVEKSQEKSAPKDLDVINANSSLVDLARHTLSTFEQARLNKQKVLSQELGFSWSNRPGIIPRALTLTDAQRNKIRVLTTEYNIDMVPKAPQIERKLTQLQINRKQNMKSNECFYNDLDNSDDINKNFEMKKSTSLILPLKKIFDDDEKPIPMSVDSTPISDLGCLTPISKTTMESSTTAAMTITEDDGSVVEDLEPNIEFIPIFSKKIAKGELDSRSINSFKLLLEQSITTPVTIQSQLINNELLRFFIEDLNYLKHLESLRNYFFMQDGEFARRINDLLFAKLYCARVPAELISIRFLENLVWEGVENSSKLQENSSRLSFKINSMPKRFNLTDPDVLDCLSLTYKINWPLNILLPSDTLAKYDVIFKFLLKLNLINWIFKQIFLELKMLAKETGQKEIYLMMSPHYRKVHQSRHIMLHFVQTLQNYFVGEVLQPSWERFQGLIANVNSIDDLYSAHTSYLKSLLFLCLLNQKAAPLRKIIQDIFVVIMKFYNYLRSRAWQCEGGKYIHPNFAKLESIFKNFEEFVVYFFKVGGKVIKSGYQPQLAQLLNILDVNSYYSKGQ